MSRASFRNLSLALFAPCALTALLASPAPAQGGGFTAGDLYIHSASVDDPVTGPSGPSIPALMHVDVSAGTASVFVPTLAGGQGSGSVVFDPYRQRLIFDGKLAPSPEPIRLWAVDALGNLEALYTVNLSLSAFAPTGDGRIYFRAAASSSPFRYLDASNDVQVLMDDTGTAPFIVDGNQDFDFRGMIYDAGTNALLIAPIGNGFCAGGVVNRINVRKLPLSADGTRVVGPITCAQYEVSTTTEAMAGFSHGPAGQIVLVVDTNTNLEEPRMLLVDPVTLAITPFASNGPYTGAAATNAGTWCSALNEVVILDTGTDVLRSFSSGATGSGTILGLAGSVSSTGASAEAVSMVEVPPSACSGAWMAYGAGLAGSGAFVPRLVGGGCPEVGGAFTLGFDRALGAASGVLFVGLAPAAVPFKGGTFHVGALLLSVPMAVGGAPGVPGVGALTLPATLPADPLLAGASVYLQVGFIDGGAVAGASLSKGLRMTIGN